MKQFAILLVAFIGAFTAFVACDDDSNGKLDEYAKIYINGKNLTNKYLQENADGTQRKLTVEEICKGDSIWIMMYDKEGEYCKGEIVHGWSAKFCEITPREEAPLYGVIDTVNMRIALSAGYVETFHDASFYFDGRYNMYVQKANIGKPLSTEDTIAYMPREYRLAAYEKMKKLFSEEELNWTEIYRVFNEGFIFVPCTGAEFKELVEKGLD